MNLARQYLLESQRNLITAAMQLRQPQAESLQTVHDLLIRLPAPISQLDAEVIADRCRQLQPEWAFPWGYPSLTYSLATGVGKTRLIGAIAAYLFRTGESRNFVVLASRDAILRKFEQDVREASKNYIFVDSCVVPQPRVCHRTNISTFHPHDGQAEFLPTGPNLFVFSPQLLVARGRIAAPSEFVGVSVEEYLKECNDLVVFVDESHHISANERDESASSWGGALTALKPKLVFEMTATPRTGAAVAYEYNLPQCLRERLYTKAVRLIVDDSGGKLPGEEYDLYTLRFAVARLQAKEDALRDVRTRMSSFPQIRPVLLIAAADTAHADAVGKLLIANFEFAADEVLVIHSKRKTEDDMTALASIEKADSRIRAVVQVHVLDEGWDVTNVYVVATLRNVESYVNARQVMGRGLRLPAGRRVGNDEADTLDVLAFGQETFEKIFEQARQEFGSPGEPDGGIEVIPVGGESAVKQLKVKHPDDARKPQTKVVTLGLVKSVTVEMPILDMIPPEPNLDVLIDGSGLRRGGRSAFDLGTFTTNSVSGELSISQGRFLEIATDEIFSGFIYLSDPLHRDSVTELLQDILETTGQTADEVAIDPVLCAKVIVEQLFSRYREVPPKYEPTGSVERIDITPAEANVPLQYVGPFDSENVWKSGWTKQTHFRIPIKGWEHCVHEAAHFDSKPEFEMAYRLDRMQEVEAWLRNEPGQVIIPTIASNTKPDFVAWLGDGRVLLLEVKGEYYWEPEQSDSWVRARDLREWLAVAGHHGGDRLAFAILLSAAIDGVETLSDIFSSDELPPETATP
jgi:superfamily II DNA or RNA helicase